MFKDDLIFGQSGEDLVLAILSKKHPNAKRILGYSKDGDIDCGNFLVEVKYDRRAIETGNLCVEHHFNGKESGILTSKARFWVFVLSPNEIYLATPLLLQTLPRKDIEFTHTGNVMQAYLIKKELVPVFSLNNL